MRTKLIVNKNIRIIAFAHTWPSFVLWQSNVFVCVNQKDYEQSVFLDMTMIVILVISLFVIQGLLTTGHSYKL